MGSAIDATALEVLMERGHMSENLGIETVELSDESVAVKWNDGHDSVYNAKYLRVSCSCAQCIEEWSRRKILDPATVPADLRAEDYLMVGRYAIQFLWSDAHYTGIYPFDMLRALCTCDQCKADREQAKGEATP
jgi:DUF971 family protein